MSVHNVTLCCYNNLQCTYHLHRTTGVNQGEISNVCMCAVALGVLGSSVFPDVVLSTGHTQLEWQSTVVYMCCAAVGSQP